MTLLRVAARPMLASMFIVGGLDSVRNASSKAAAAKPVTDKIVPLIKKVAPQAPVPTDEATLVRINGAVQLVAGAALATGRFPRLASLVLASTLAPTTLAGHAFWNETDPGVRTNQRVHFLKNVSMAGGLLLASLDPDPHKKILPRRAKDRAVDARDRAVNAVENLRH